MKLDLSKLEEELDALSQAHSAVMLIAGQLDGDDHAELMVDDAVRYAWKCRAKIYSVIHQVIGRCQYGGPPPANPITCVSTAEDMV